MAFNIVIKNIRLSCLLSQSEFGDALGVSFATVNRWENGKSKPNIKTMKALKSFCTLNNIPYEKVETSWLASNEVE